MTHRKEKKFCATQTNQTQISLCSAVLRKRARQPAGSRQRTLLLPQQAVTQQPPLELRVAMEPEVSGGGKNRSSTAIRCQALAYRAQPRSGHVQEFKQAPQSHRQAEDLRSSELKVPSRC